MDPGRDGSEICATQRFIRDDRHVHVVGKPGVQVPEACTGHGLDVRFFEQRLGEAGVAASGSKDEAHGGRHHAFRCSIKASESPMNTGLPSSMPLKAVRGLPMTRPVASIWNSRIVCSCSPVRFLITDTARWMAPLASK